MSDNEKFIHNTKSSSTYICKIVTENLLITNYHGFFELEERI